MPNMVADISLLDDFDVALLSNAQLQADAAAVYSAMSFCLSPRSAAHLFDNDDFTIIVSPSDISMLLNYELAMPAAAPMPAAISTLSLLRFDESMCLTTGLRCDLSMVSTMSSQYADRGSIAQIKIIVA